MRLNKHEGSFDYWIKRYSLLMEREMDSILKPYGLGRSQWYILYCIDTAQEGYRQKELQAGLHVESATMTNLVTNLVRKGWIRQSSDPADRRGKLLAFTPKGKEMWRALPDPIDCVRAHALKGFSESTIQQTSAAIEAAVHNLEEKRRN